MKLFLTVPHQRYYADEIVQFRDAAQAMFNARGWSLIWDPVKDRPTMACRNNQVNRFLSTPCDVFLTLDYDCLPTTKDGRPDIDGLMHLVEDLATDEIDVVGGWTLMHFEHQQTLVPCIAHPPGTDPSKPDEWPVDFVAPYSKDPLTELKGGGLGAHCLAFNRNVVESMRAAGRLYFEDVHDRDPASPTFGGRILGHDFAFCQLAVDLGFRVWMDNRVFWGHVKDVDLRWIHDLVKGQAERIDAHLAVADALAGARDPGLAGWFLLRIAEEAANVVGMVQSAPGAPIDVLASLVGHDRLAAHGDMREENDVGLICVRHDDDLRGSDGEYFKFYLRPDCVIVTDRRDSENLDAVIKGMNVVHIENVGEGGVIRCA